MVLSCLLGAPACGAANLGGASTAPPPVASPASPRIGPGASIEGSLEGGGGGGHVGVVPRAVAPTAHCGALTCWHYESPEGALRDLLVRRPRVIALGEAHALRGSAIPSTARLFTDRLLPILEGTASDVVLELMVAPSGCDAATRQVRTAQKVLTDEHVPTNEPGYETQNQLDYVAMGQVARTRGLAADLLHPSCANVKAMRDAGKNTLPTMMELIARLTTDKVRALLAAGSEQVVIYGGAIHNDIAPSPARAGWSYGPALREAADGKYIELDIFAPESIDDRPMWKTADWFPHFDRSAHKDATTLIERRPGSYVLILAAASP